MTGKARQQLGDDRARRHAARRWGELRLRRERRELGDRRVAGRAWLNGREVGGTAARLAYLEASHD